MDKARGGRDEGGWARSARWGCFQARAREGGRCTGSSGTLGTGYILERAHLHHAGGAPTLGCWKSMDMEAARSRCDRPTCGTHARSIYGNILGGARRISIVRVGAVCRRSEGQCARCGFWTKMRRKAAQKIWNGQVAFLLIIVRVCASEYPSNFRPWRVVPC